jgi:uncharacterized 2Fe-2S/4Fe-4S cluster protein (DUF4445 family)
MTALHRIVFTPSGLEGKVADGTTVLDAARQLGADLDTVCGGRGICGRCQIAPSIGRFAKWAIDAAPGALGDRSVIELDYHGARPLADGNRLGCAARILGDVVIDVPAASQVHRQVVRKQLDLAELDVDPSFSLYYVEVPPARLGDALSASAALCSAVAGQHGVERPELDRPLLRSVHAVLAADAGRVTVAIQNGERLVAAWPGYVDTAYGIAVDVGSTTVAGHLCDLSTGEIVASAGRMNPQIRFGEDLMSRVSYVMMNPGGDRELTAVIRTAIDELAGELVEAAGVGRDRVLELVVVGNPIMHHVVLGIDPTPLGSAPFVLATDEAVTGPASEIGLDLAHASFYAGPCIAGHVGADTAAAILAEGPHRGDGVQLLVDVGTNAEIVLGDRRQVFAASSPTGPAFEGAQISCGQRATAGAVERVRIDPVTFEPELGVIGGGDVITGVCGSGIIDALAEMSLVGIIDADGTIRGELMDNTPRVVPDGRTFAYVLYERGDTRLAIRQNDVRAIQLAKAALRAGVELLLEHAGSPPIASVRLAGAFGAHIDPYHAIVLGLVPDVGVERVRSVGNAAGAGAVQALLSRSRRAEMEDAVRSVVKIETATEPRFQELFVAAMGFPYATAPGSSRGRRRRAATS